MSGSVVERWRWVNDLQLEEFTEISTDDLRLLLAAVEAAKDVQAKAFPLKEPGVHRHIEIHRVLWDSLGEALDALYAEADSRPRKGRITPIPELGIVALVEDDPVSQQANDQSATEGKA